MDLNPTSKHYRDPDLGGYVLETVAGRVRYIRWFYDRSLRLWTVTAHDKRDNQVGSAFYSPNRDSLVSAIEDRLSGY